MVLSPAVVVVLTVRDGNGVNPGFGNPLFQDNRPDTVTAAGPGSLAICVTRHSMVRCAHNKNTFYY